VVILGIVVGPLRMRALCRVIYTITAPRRKGFAYGTLPGHPECGEEAFTISSAMTAWLSSRSPRSRDRQPPRPAPSGRSGA
jgi:uncharacterized protein (UPF0548 family)